MLERAGARFWVSIVAGAIAFPVAAVVLLAVWLIRFQIVTPSTSAEPSRVAVAAASPVSPVQQKVESPVPPQRGAVTESIASPPTAPTPEPSSTMPTLGNASSADTDRAQQALPQETLPQEILPQDARLQDALAQLAQPPVPSTMAAEPAAVEPAEPDAGVASPVPVPVEVAKALAPEETAKPLPPETVGERFAPAVETKAPDFTPALSVFATLAVVPPKLGTAYADPNQDGLTKPATPKLSEPISGPVPLPRPKPRVAANLPVAPVNAGNVNRWLPPSPSARPVGSNSPPRTAPAPR